MLVAPHVGHRDARTEDRQLLLDALLAATDRLIVTFEGRDERTHTRRPPAVPVGELLDTIEHTVRVPEGEVADRVVIHHPLQPFDRRNFTVGELAPERSFDRVMLAGARARGETRRRPGPKSEIDTAEESTWNALKLRVDADNNRRPLLLVYDEAQNLTDQHGGPSYLLRSIPETGALGPTLSIRAFCLVESRSY